MSLAHPSKYARRRENHRTTRSSAVNGFKEISIKRRFHYFWEWVIYSCIDNSGDDTGASYKHFAKIEKDSYGCARVLSVNDCWCTWAYLELLVVHSLFVNYELLVDKRSATTDSDCLKIVWTQFFLLEGGMYRGYAPRTNSSEEFLREETVKNNWD